MEGQNQNQVVSGNFESVNSQQQFVQQVSQMAPGQFAQAVSSLVPTNIVTLKSYAGGQVVELPSFGEGQPFIARIKRPSMLALVKSGKIPNQLLTTANELFAGGGNLDTDNQNMMKDIFGVMDVICEASLIEPSYAEIREAGLELTDDQLMFIFNYSQQGVNALKSFRQ